MDPLALSASPFLPAIFTAILVEQLWGFAYYNPQTLSPAWLKAWKLNPKKVNRRDPIPFALSLLRSAFVAMTLDYLIRHLGWTSAWGGLRAALYAFFGFNALTLAMHYRFAQVSAKAALIDLGYDFLALCSTGLILGAWR